MLRLFYTLLAAVLVATAAREDARGQSGTSVLSAAKTSAEAARYHLQIFPGLPGQESMYAKDMNDRDVIAGHAGSDPWDPLAVPLVLVNGVAQILPQPTQSLNFALGIGRRDLVAGSSSGVPYVWESGIPRQLFAEGLYNGEAWDANRQGHVCGTMVNDITGWQFPVLWTDTSAPGQYLPAAASQGAAFAINDHGQIGGITIGNGFAFVGARWDDPDEEPLQIGPLPGDVNSEVVALNELGDAAGRSTSASGLVQAMFYESGTEQVIGIGVLGGTYSEAHGMNDLAQVVGTSSAPGGVAHGFLWQGGMLQDLNDLVTTASGPFVQVTSGVGIDELGRIVVEVEVPVPGGTATRVGLLTPDVLR